MFETRKYEIAALGYINESKIFEAYGARCGMGLGDKRVQEE